MKITKNFIRTTDRHEVYYEIYEPKQPRAHVHIVHGMAEHIGRYEEFARFLAGKGYVVSGHDQRGHGRTAERNGVQGFFAEKDGFSRVVEDMERVIETVQTQFEKMPLIILGHSMGSFVVRRFIQLHSDRIEGVVLSGTGGDPGAAGKAGLLLAMALGKTAGKDVPSPVLGKLTFGSFSKQFIGEESPFAWLSRDASEVALYEADPMSGFVSTNQFYLDLFTGLALIHKNAEVAKIRKDLPMLLISGTHDPVGGNGKDIFKVAEQYKKAGLQKVSVYLAEDARHELLHEIDRSRHFAVIADWMSAND